MDPSISLIRSRLGGAKGNLRNPYFSLTSQFSANRGSALRTILNCPDILFIGKQLLYRTINCLYSIHRNFKQPARKSRVFNENTLVVKKIVYRYRR